MSPTAPLANRQLVWHLYSAQAYGIFHGDLDMYFGYEIRCLAIGQRFTDTCAVCLDLSLTQAFRSQQAADMENERLFRLTRLTGGWDGRSRMSSIDTKKCPVYMLTGEYDWSNTPEMGQATCEKITGGKHQAMKGVGHFPATENPKVFVGYCEYSFPGE